MPYLPQEFLYQLISKLESRQKKEFANTLKSGTRNKTNYQTLFEELCDLDKYDEVKLKHRLNKSMTDEVIAVVKNKLTEKLLDYLRYTNEETASKKLHKLLDYMEVLFKKQMYHEVVFYCEKVKKEAWQNDFHTIVIEANRWKGFCLPYTQRENYLEAREEIRKEILKSHNMISLTYTASDYYHQVVGKIQEHFNFRNEKFRNDMSQMMENPLFSVDASSKEYSFMPAAYLAMTKHFLYKIQGDYEAAFEQERIVWNRIKDDFNFHYKNKRAETMGTVVNYMEALSKTKHTDAFIEHMAFMEKLLAKEEKANHQLETALRIYQLNHLAKLKGEVLTEEEIEPFQRIYDSGIANQFVEYKRIFECYLANAYFLVREYEKARDLMVIAQKEYTRTEVRSDNYEYSRINQILYEGTRIISLGVTNDDIPGFQTLVSPYYDLIRHKPKEDDYRVERALIDFFRSLKQNMEHEKVLKKISVLEKELDTIFSEDLGYLKLIRGDFDYPVMIKRWREYLG
jgi:hypothetical protein